MFFDALCFWLCVWYPGHIFDKKTMFEPCHSWLLCLTYLGLCLYFFHSKNIFLIFLICLIYLKIRMMKNNWFYNESLKSNPLFNGSGVQKALKKRLCSQSASFSTLMFHLRHRPHMWFNRSAIPPGLEIGSETGDHWTEK